MLKHTFSDFSYAVNIESKKKKHKEVLVCFIYNGVEVLKKVYVPEGKGIAYVFEAKKIIDQEMRDGSLAVYSHKFIYKNRKKGIQPRKVVAAVAKGEKASSVPLAPTKVATAKANKPKESSPKNNNGKKWLIAGGCVVVVAALVLGTYFLTKSLTSKPSSKEYPVSFETTGCECKGDSVVQVGKKYECTFTPTADESVAIDYVKMGSKTLGDTEYTFVDNILTIQKVASADIKIKAHTTPNAYKVTFNGVGCTLKEGSPTSVSIGGEYECDITAQRTTESPVISEITMSGVPLTGLDYTFTGSHLHINKGATGPINITAGVETTTFNVTCDCGSELTFTGETTVKKGATQYSCQIPPKDTDKKQTSIDSVRMGGKLLTPGKDYNFNSENNTLLISTEASGDINIVASAVVAKYEVNYHVMNCEMVKEESPTEISVGGFLSCSLKAQEGSRKNAIAGVSMGGIQLINEEQYHFDDSTNKLTLKVGATGNIVVSAMSYDPGTDRFEVKFESGDGCEAIATMTDIELGTSIEANLEVEDSTTKKVYVDAVVMGGVSLKEGTGYTFDPQATPNNFKVFNITSNVLVKFSAIDIGDITAEPKYELSEDKQSYKVIGFELPSGKSESEIDSITIEPTYAKNSNDNPLPVTSIDNGVLNKYSNLKELSIPFIGAKKLNISDDPRDGTQLFGYIFGDTPYSGASATWQYYYDESEVLHPRKFIIPNSLKTVTITGDDHIIPAGAFSSCRSLDEIKFTQNKATVVKNYAFNGCVSLRSIQIPDTIATIEELAFQNCETLQHIDLPASLTTIASYAFNNCKSLLKVRLNNQIEQMGTQAFSGIRGGVIACEKTKSQVAASSHWDKNWVDTGTTVVYGAISTNDYVDTSKKFHFMLVKSDDGTETIGAHVAEYVGLSTDSTITIPETVTPEDSNVAYPIFALGDYMFSEYSVTTKFVFNCKQLTSIGSYCFSYCSTLTELEGFANLTNLKEIGAYCFGACLSLNISGVPQSVTSIGEYAFAYNYAITEFDLSENNITAINEGLFYYCVNLEDVTLPEGITYLGNNVFEECYALTSLELNTVGITAIPYALCYCVEDPAHPERVSKMTSFVWNSSTPLTAIGGSAFGGCTALTSVTFGDSTANHLPTSVGTVGDYAFTRCTKISSFYIDKSSTGVTSINMGLEIFKNWTGSQVLYINSGWVTGGGFLSTEATLAWGWKLSRPMLSGNFHCSKTGSDSLVINKA